MTAIDITEITKIRTNKKKTLPKNLLTETPNRPSGGISSPPPQPSLKNSKKNGKIHPEFVDDNINTSFYSVNTSTSSKMGKSTTGSSSNSKKVEESSSPVLLSSFTKIDKRVSGHASTTVHKEFSSFGNELLNFENGSFLREYYNQVGKREGGGKIELPVPTVIQVTNEDCVIVQSFRYSSSSNIVLRSLQCFAKVQIFSKSIELAFYSISKRNVPDEAQTSENEFFKLHGLTVLDDEYSEDGNMILSSHPHQQTQFVFNIRIGFSSKSLTLVKVHKLLQSALHIAKVANEKYDRSEEVDNAVQSHFISVVMPNVPST